MKLEYKTSLFISKLLTIKEIYDGQKNLERLIMTPPPPKKNKKKMEKCFLGGGVDRYLGFSGLTRHLTKKKPGMASF
jgi:hypothetical protein